jgi:N-acyl-D-aspartate/D-glutamate deacylase
MADTVIRGGLVVDGTGAPGEVRDVGIRDGRFVPADEVGPGADEVDATGLVVAPGFVDLHTHYDAQLSWDPSASPSPLHGVTTAIGGNCGFTIAPAGEEHAPYLMRMMARVEGMPLEALEAGLAWDWSGFTDWMDRLEGGIGINAGFLIGHSAVRRVVMGDACHEPATAEQVDAMARIVADACAVRRPRVLHLHRPHPQRRRGRARARPGAPSPTSWSPCPPRCGTSPAPRWSASSPAASTGSRPRRPTCWPACPPPPAGR